MLFMTSCWMVASAGGSRRYSCQGRRNNAAAFRSKPSQPRHHRPSRHRHHASSDANEGFAATTSSRSLQNNISPSLQSRIQDLTSPPAVVWDESSTFGGKRANISAVDLEHLTAPFFACLLRHRRESCSMHVLLVATIIGCTIGGSKSCFIITPLRIGSMQDQKNVL